jgi:hypothetical protein
MGNTNITEMKNLKIKLINSTDYLLIGSFAIFSNKCHPKNTILRLNKGEVITYILPKKFEDIVKNYNRIKIISDKVGCEGDLKDWQS